jgi:hypothetical protein
VRWQNRAYFFGVAAQLMRHILVDFARARRRAERGGYKQQVSLEEAAVVSKERCADFIALGDTLKLSLFPTVCGVYGVSVADSL